MVKIVYHFILIIVSFYIANKENKQNIRLR